VKAQLFFITCLLSFSVVYGQSERFEKMLEEQNEESRTREAIVKAGGDRAEVIKSCPRPAAWRPELDITTASEWDIVPVYIRSKTYDRKGGYQLFLEAKGASTCDYYTVKFNNNLIESVDISKCRGMKNGAPSGIAPASQKNCFELIRKYFKIIDKVSPR